MGMFAAVADNMQATQQQPMGQATKPCVVGTRWIATLLIANLLCRRQFHLDGYA